MHLFELAIELGERSADLADAAPGLGLGTLTPTSVLTPEQVRAFRAHYGAAPAGGGGPNPYPGSQGTGPAAWGAPPSLPPPPPPPGSRGGGGRRLRFAATGAAVVAVLGLFGFMVANSGMDQERLDRIAAAEPIDEGPTVIGPDGKPLTDEERSYLAAVAASEAEHEEKVCRLLTTISNHDIAASRQTPKDASLEQLAGMMVEENSTLQPLLTEAMALVPSQAENIRQVKEFSDHIATRIQATGTSDPAALRQVFLDLREEPAPPGLYQAAIAFDDYAQETCGVSVSQN